MQRSLSKSVSASPIFVLSKFLTRIGYHIILYKNAQRLGMSQNDKCFFLVNIQAMDESKDNLNGLRKEFDHECEKTSYFFCK